MNISFWNLSPHRNPYWISDKKPFAIFIKFTGLILLCSAPASAKIPANCRDIFIVSVSQIIGEIGVVFAKESLFEAAEKNSL